jgi:hypothetical protein|tara:strand:- start:24 stop:416 length:393 start_codon:yes stop_codon:yes gene_type:complete
MASVLKVDSITGVTTAGSISVTGEGNSTTTNLQQGLAKAWVEGSNAAALTDSFNISGGTDNGTGDYSYAFSNNMGSASYSISVCCHSGGLAATNDDSQTTSSYKVQIFSRTSTGSASDQINYSAIHGDLA